MAFATDRNWINLANMEQLVKRYNIKTGEYHGVTAMTAAEREQFFKVRTQHQPINMQGFDRF